MEKYGFSLVGEDNVTDLNSVARLWLHQGSGAQLLSFVNKDENKVFGVSFRTPPHDSTGLPHILEHSVLCGSEKYPVKEPFVELLKGSLQTFLNAFTYPDKTCYPVASTNLQDFYNLIDVYLDAAFHPRINEEIFQQEGWHLDAVAAEAGADQEPEISFKGVVYNEMKGVFSSPEAVLERQSMHALFPDTPYGLESGGDPADIPGLTFADFVNFHRTYYHPSNARFFFWGDDPEDKRLEIAAKELERYQKIDVSGSVVPVQKPFAEPKTLRLPFAGNEDDKAMFTLNWVLPEVTVDAISSERVMAFAMLEHILLGMPASPLRRALMESGLGEDLAGNGMQDELKQMMFSIGLKGIAEESATQVEALILSTLRNLVQDGIPAVAVEAAINSVEFELRENNTGNFPVGLAIMVRTLNTWLHADTPNLDAALAPVRFSAILERVKEQTSGIDGANGKGYFERLINDYILQNKHRVSILLYPDASLGQQMEEQEAARLAALTNKLSAAQKASLVEQTEKLKVLQETPDTPAALASIPCLHLGDLPRFNREIEQTSLEIGLAPAFYHPQPTNGICYFSSNFDISAVPDRLLPLVPLLGRAMLEMGNETRNYIELNMDIARKTGGIDAELTLLTRLQDAMPIGALSINGKAAPDKIGDLFAITAELLLGTSLDNKEQFIRILLEEKARLEHGLIPAGHRNVGARLRGSLSLTGWLNEQSSGLAYLEAIRALCAEAESNWASVLKKLEETRKIVVNLQNLIISMTAEERQYDEARAATSAFAAMMPRSTHAPVARVMEDLPKHEALITPAQVNFVGRGLNLYSSGYEYHGSALVVLKYLRTGYLWEKVRVQGGAYGAMCSLDRATGDFVLASFRDPNIENTLKVYDNCAAYLQENKPDKRALESAVIGAIGELDAYLLPEAKGHAAFLRKLSGNTAELRAKLRDEVLGTSVEDIERFGVALAAAMPDANTVALGGNALEEVAKREGWSIKKVL